MNHILRRIYDKVTVSANLDFKYVSSDFYLCCDKHVHLKLSCKNSLNTFRANSFLAWAVGLIVWNNKLRLVEILVL